MLSKTITAHRLLCFALALGFAAPCLAQKNAADIDKLFSPNILKTQLFAKTAEERQFCDHVIQKRDDGTLPTRLIYGVYRKAIAEDRNRRFAYFKIGLEVACRREGIALYSTPVKTSAAPPSFIRNLFSNLRTGELDAVRK